MRELTYSNKGVCRDGIYIPYPEEVIYATEIKIKVIRKKFFFINGFELLENNIFKRTAKAIFHLYL